MSDFEDDIKDKLINDSEFRKEYHQEILSEVLDRDLFRLLETDLFGHRYLLQFQSLRNQMRIIEQLDEMMSNGLEVWEAK